MRGPTRCLWEGGANLHNIIMLAKVEIHLRELSRCSGYTYSYLSRVLSGDQEPSMKAGKRIAHELGMSFQDFLEAVQERADENDALLYSGQKMLKPKKKKPVAPPIQ